MKIIFLVYFIHIYGLTQNMSCEKFFDAFLSTKLEKIRLSRDFEKINTLKNIDVNGKKIEISQFIGGGNFGNAFLTKDMKSIVKIYYEGSLYSNIRLLEEAKREGFKTVDIIEVDGYKNIMITSYVKGLKHSEMLKGLSLVDDTSPEKTKLTQALQRYNDITLRLKELNSSFFLADGNLLYVPTINDWILIDPT